MLSHTKIVSSWFSRWGRPVIAGALVLAGLAFLFIWNGGTVRILGVDSASMVPMVSKGDAVVVRPVNPLDLRKGDIISYRSPDDSSIVITHRVLVVDPQTGQLITKGDANSTLDPAFASTAIVGRVNYIIPGAGHILDALHTWAGLVLLVYIPTLLLLVSELWRLGKHYLRPTYVLHQRRF